MFNRIEIGVLKRSTMFHWDFRFYFGIKLNKHTNNASKMTEMLKQKGAHTSKIGYFPRYAQTLTFALHWLQ